MINVRFNIAALALIVSQVGCVTNDVPTLKHLNDRSLVVEKQELAAVSQEEVMKSYHQYIDQAPSNHPMYNSALSRLADLEMIAGDDKLFTEKEEQYQKAFAAQATQNDAQVDKNYKNAIELYEGLLTSNPDDKRNEWVLYKLARAYESIGELEKALLVLSRLVSEFPQSEYYMEAQFRRGEINFSLGDFINAETALQRVVNRGRSTVFYERALYKYAWSQFKQDHYEDALSSFFVLLNTLPVVYDLQEKIDTRALSKVEKDMLDDIFRAINLCFSYAGGVSYTEAYFARTSKVRYEYEVFVRLGEYFKEHDRTQDAADVYGVFVQRNRFHPMSSSMQIQRITAYEKARFDRSALVAREEFVEQFGIGTEFWYRQNTATKAILKEQVRQILGELSEYYHSRLQSTKRKEYFDSAVLWYEQYVKMFPDDPDSAAKMFLLGELYSEENKLQQAAVVYEKSAYDFAEHKDSQAAAYALVDTYNKMLKLRSSIQLREKLADASFRLLEKYPGIEKSDSIRARLVEDLFALRRYQQAYQQAQVLIVKKDAARWVKVTAYIVAGHVAFDQKDYLQAQSNYDAALKLGINNQKLDQEVRQKVAASAYKHAEGLKNGGDLAGAAEGFLALQQIAPDSEVTVKALYDSATAYFQMQNFTKSIELLEEFRGKYPDHNLSLDASKKLLIAYEKNELWAKAAGELLLLAAQSTDNEFKRDAIWQAAFYFEKVDNKPKAIETYKTYVRNFSSPFPQFVEGHQKLIDLYFQINEFEKRRYWAEQVADLYRRNQNKFDDRGKYIAANATFILATEEMMKYRSVSLKLPLKRSLQQKNTLLKSTIKAYEAVADIGVAEFVTASTYHVGEVYQQLAQSIMKSQRPRKLKKDELEEYDLQLEEQAYPFEEKAIQIYESNVARIKNGVFDSWIQQSINKLAQLQPARYQKQEVHDEVYTSLD